MNAAAMVSLARNWTLVPTKTICEVEPTLLARKATARGADGGGTEQQDGGGVNMTGLGGQVISLKFTVGHNCRVVQLEHVQVRLSTAVM